MFTNIEYENLNSTLQESFIRRGIKLKKIWGMLFLLVVLVIGVLLLLFPKQFDNAETAWILPVYGGLAFFTTLIGFLISFSYKSEKPFFTYLYQEVIHKINQNEGLYLTYDAYPKSTKEFNENGGLFTRYASIKTRRLITGRTEEDHFFDIKDCTLTTSNGKSQNVHFDGVYFQIQKTTSTTLQVRTSGSPKKKGSKYVRSEEFNTIRVYKLENENISNIDYLFINFVTNLLENQNYKKIYLSVVEEGIHFAVSYKKHPLRKQKVFSYQTLEDIVQDFLDELEIIKKLDTIDSYNY